MWLQSYTVLDVLPYLKNVTYPSLPAPLWNRDLWMYGWIEDWTGSYFGQGRMRDFNIHVCRDDETQTGLALSRYNKDAGIWEVLVDTRCADDLFLLYSQLSSSYECGFVITVRDREFADAVVKLVPELAVEPGKVKLYSMKRVEPPPRAIELTADHHSRLWQKQWTSFPDMIIAGFRFFGVEIDGTVLSTAGLWPHTQGHVEIIAVGTEPKHMRKGYAKEACSLALNTGLEAADVVTWSTDITNEPSQALARRLGFDDYLTTYHLIKFTS